MDTNTIPKPVRKKIKNSTIPLPGDVYVKRLAVYRVMIYNESDDTVLFATTNDVITIYGKIKRTHIRANDLYSCPFQLLKPAVQVFELDEKFNEESLNCLYAYYYNNINTYKKLGLPELLEDIDEATMRVYQIPDEQGDQFPDLKGKSFNIPIPFYCLTKEVYKERYAALGLPMKEEYFRAMKYTAWPIFYVPARFG